jgi:hypothetical protein
LAQISLPCFRLDCDRFGHPCEGCGVTVNELHDAHDVSMTARFVRTPQIRHGEDAHREFQSQTNGQSCKCHGAEMGGRGVQRLERHARAPLERLARCMYNTFARSTCPPVGRRVIASRSQSATLDVPATSNVDYCCIPRYDFTLALHAVAHSQGYTLPSHPPSGNSPPIAAALGGPEQVLEVGSLCRACRIMGQF